LWTQNGHVVWRRVRSRTLVRHSWSGRTEHRHQQTRDEPANISRGVVLPLFVGCHSAAIQGKQAARLFELETFRFAQ
jgi:hypothetical protein